VHKDLFCTKGVLTTCGSHMLDNFVSPYDATVVAKLKSAGAITLAKSNMDEFAMGSSNETSYFGPVRNPWNTDLVPGGSSGGSAAAVAARLTPVATATDTGGSIRQPAALCGVTGVKPTYGRVSRYGMIAFASSLDQGGVIAGTAADAALILREMSGFDPNDSTSVDMPVPDYVAGLDAPLAGLKIGLLKEFFDKGLDAENEKRIREALAVYERLGATLKEVSLPNLPLSVPAYYVVAPAECSSNLARFDGVRFGHRAKDPRDLMDLYKRSRGEGFGAEVKRRIMTGTYVLSAGYYDAYYLKAQKVRQLIAADFKRAFGEVDVLMGPTTPTAAFPIGAKTSDPITMYLNDIYTIGANLAGLPAMSIPCGFSAGLPVGLQIVGPHFSEGKLLNAAHVFQRETDWHTRIPEAFK
jgi:aspartyl-tRNA(Asn)/glutamyl-tRNA(Gln) amidotransferase subunit A